jgi:hypothetical protein
MAEITQPSVRYESEDLIKAWTKERLNPRASSQPSLNDFQSRLKDLELEATALRLDGKVQINQQICQAGMKIPNSSNPHDVTKNYQNERLKADQKAMGLFGASDKERASALEDAGHRTRIAESLKTAKNSLGFSASARKEAAAFNLFQSRLEDHEWEATAISLDGKVQISQQIRQAGIKIPKVSYPHDVTKDFQNERLKADQKATRLFGASARDKASALVDAGHRTRIAESLKTTQNSLAFIASAREEAAAFHTTKF